MKAPVLYDRYLIFAIVAILGIGLMMVASASMVISDHLYSEPFYYIAHQTAFLIAGLVLCYFLLRVKVEQWQKISPQLLLFSLLLLALVIIPGIGHSVNGSMRWIGIGPIGMQVSEVAKFAVILYVAGYLVRREQEVRTRVSGFVKPLAIIGVMSILLLKEPDFGTVAVIMITALGMLFLAGVRVWQFVILLSGAAAILAILAISSPYRVERLTTFLNPWATAYGGGYQLTQSLIAFGRGGWFGVGLGNSVQKLFYLPEAHTDFLFAVLAEELGLIGEFVVIGLFCLLVGRALLIGRAAFREKQYFGAYSAYGIGFLLAMQFIINIGVNTGLFPTKGLTLPMMSYGGSSLVMNCIILTFLLRIDHETRIRQNGLQRGY